MWYVNANTGWITLYSPFNTIKTTDGGQSWVVQLSGNTLRAGFIQFFNDSVGVSLGSNSSNQSTILKTTNGGVNWNAIHISSGDLYRGISFVNKDTGWVCGDNGIPLLRIWRTTDGGSTFPVQYAGAGGSFQKIFMLKEKVNGEYVGWSIVEQSLYKTINSGVNWNLINSGIGGGCQSLYDIYFIDSSNGIITRNLSCFSKTTDGGYTWIHFYEFGSVNSSIGVGDNNTFWLTLGTVDTLIKTTNFFQTYGKQVSASHANVIYAVDTSIVFAGRDMLNMEKTTNGGGPFVEVKKISSKVPGEFMLYQNYPNPFNPSTIIKLDLPKSSSINLVICDVLGREIYTFANRYLTAGSYSFTWDASDYPSGLYFYSLNADGAIIDTKKMVLLK